MIILSSSLPLSAFARPLSSDSNILSRTARLALPGRNRVSSWLRWRCFILSTFFQVPRMLHMPDLFSVPAPLFPIALVVPYVVFPLPFLFFLHLSLVPQYSFQWPRFNPV